MKFKKILISFIVCFLFFTSGCATVEFSRTITSEGVIVDAISVTLSEEDIENASLNYDEVKNYVVNKISGYMSNIINSFYSREDNLLAIEKINVMQNITNQVYTKDDHIVAYFKFNNYTVFKYFYGLHLIDSSNDDGTTTIEGFLYDKTISSGKTIFSGVDARTIENEFLNYFNGNFTLSDVSYEYMFGTYDSKMYSDADQEFTEDGINYHVWMINPENTSEEIHTYYLQLHPVNWYVLALIITAIFIVSSYIYVLIKKISKRKTPTQNLNINLKN